MWSISAAPFFASASYTGEYAVAHHANRIGLLTWVLRVDVPLPWDGGINEGPRGVGVNEQRQVDRDLRTASPPDIRRERPDTQCIITRQSGERAAGAD